MTPQQKEIVRTTFETIKAKKEYFSEVLYKKLFELEPKSQALFRGDMVEQRRKLMRMLQISVEHLDNPAELQPMLFNLGQIHHSFGIEPHQFSSFGDALVFSVHVVLGSEYTPEAEQAWRAVYQYLDSTMHNHPHNENVQLPHN
jgi:hemoglobin-like flavoprotein